MRLLVPVFLIAGLVSSIAVARDVARDYEKRLFKVGEQVPVHELLQIMPDGTTAGADIASGKKFTLVEFIMTHCGPCKANVKEHLPKLMEKIGKYTQLRLVAFQPRRHDDTPLVRRVNNFRRKYADYIDYPIALDMDRTAKKAYKVRYTPTTYLLDSNRKVLFRKVGAFKPEDIEKVRKIVRRARR